MKSSPRPSQIYAKIPNVRLLMANPCIETHVVNVFIDLRSITPISASLLMFGGQVHRPRLRAARVQELIAVTVFKHHSDSLVFRRRAPSRVVAVVRRRRGESAEGVGGGGQAPPGGERAG